MAYSSLLFAVHDEKHPIGNIGRGTHYSVFSCPQWTTETLVAYHDNKALIQRFAVIWDEDHDERIIPIIERAYLDGMLAPVKFIGERKGSLAVIVDNKFWNSCDRRNYSLRWEKFGNCVPDDSWHTEVYSEDEAVSSGIIQHSGPHVATYLKNIDYLWSLGVGRGQEPAGALFRYRDPLI